MLPTRLKVGLLGAGYILDSHAKALQALSNVSIHAVGDSSRGRARHAAEKFGIPTVVGSIEEMAASDCDVVHILLPPAIHIEAACVILEAGKSVFLEKPMGIDSAECLALDTRAARTGAAVGVNHNFLFNPHYESLREEIKRGELGRLDSVALNWHFELPILKFGPFDNWMLSAPANILFELGSHLAAFAVDIVGLPEIISATAGNPIHLPTGQIVYRHWTVSSRSGDASVLFSISLTAGQADRFLRVRGRGGSAQLDFGRSISWRDDTVTDNPVFDSYKTAVATSRSLRNQARHDGMRRLRSLLEKRPDSNPFEESIYRSIRAFYSNGLQRVDSRHSAKLGADVIRFCEAVAAATNVGAPSLGTASAPLPVPQVPPTVLVVGGTGFIGRGLVRRLVERGFGVRILTRNPRAAAIEFSALPVELCGGSHGDPDCVKRALDGIDTVYHLAKCEGKRWQDYVEGDINPTRVLAEAARAAGIRRFIYTGTISSYASDDPGSTIDNRTPVDPRIASRGHYARSKAACEALLQELHRREGFPLVIMRPGIVIGPGSPPAHLGVGRFTSETKVHYWGSGENPLPLVLVDDVADALALAANAPNIDGQTLLLTSPPLLSAREYIEALGLHLKAQIDARPRAPWRYWVADLVKEIAKNAIRHPNRRWPSLHDSRCNSHRARYDSHMTEEALGWHPAADREAMIAGGIADTVVWFLR